MSQRTVSFIIGGAPRSGTTLTRQLVNDFPEVAVPQETHFFRRFFPRRVPPDAFPLRGANLRAALEEFGRLPRETPLHHFDAAEIAGDLGGHCTTPFELFSAIVRHLAGDARIYGEKTPYHLRWWKPLSEARSDFRFIGLVRDPRAVVASATKRWGRQALSLANSWNSFERELQRAKAHLGSRVLILQYENVVTDVDATYAQLAAFLQLGHSVRTPAPVDGVVARREIETTSVGRWRESLDETTAKAIAARCRPGMKRFGYPTLSRWAAKRAELVGDDQDQKYWYEYERSQRAIESMCLV